MQTNVYKRVRMLFILMLLILSLLGVRLLNIQLINGNKYTTIADNIRTQTIPGEDVYRGEILDRTGQTLTDSKEQLALVLFPSMLKEKDKAISVISSQLQINADDIYERLDLAKKIYMNQPFVLMKDLTQNDEAYFKSMDIAGVHVLPIKKRYGENSLATHLVGHLNKIDEKKWESLKNSYREGGYSYKKSDLIGVKGIESIYEEYLRSPAQANDLAATVDAKGRMLTGLGISKIFREEISKTRNDVYLTIDKNIQQIVEEVIDTKINKGAVVVVDVTTGQVLAMASRPDFNQNDISNKIYYEQKSFVNKALELYFPGSTFKVLIAAAALDNDLVSPNQGFYCSGEYTFDSGVSISCWKEGGHGRISFTQALADSCNPTFIEVTQKLGRVKIIEYLNKFGLDQNTLLGYKKENNTGIHIDQYSKAALGNVAIGQNGIMLTPLQVASLMATIANNGLYNEPQILLKVVNGENKTVKKAEKVTPARAIKLSTAQKLQDMLVAATITGTAQNAWLEEWGSAGKTSSAQTGKFREDGREILNVWFAGYAPLKNPKYAVAIIMEDGTTGGHDAAPIFKEILEKILSMDKSNS